MKIKPRAILITLLLLAVFASANAALMRFCYGQTKPEPKIETCIVDIQNEDKTKTIHCETFDFKLNSWPAVWDLYKSKGEKVQVRVDSDNVTAIAPPCRDRIRRTFLQHADGSLARESVSKITPADCMDIPEKEREIFTKEP